jgi:hypothetical protein
MLKLAGKRDFLKKTRCITLPFRFQERLSHPTVWAAVQLVYARRSDPVVVWTKHIRAQAAGDAGNSANERHDSHIFHHGKLRRLGFIGLPCPSVCHAIFETKHKHASFYFTTFFNFREMDSSLNVEFWMGRVCQTPCFLSATLVGQVS